MSDKTVRGRFVWHELMTPEVPAAHSFYSKVVGWKIQPWEQDPSYTMFAASSGPLGGVVATTEGAPCWVPYLGTTDIEATLQQASGLGAIVTKGITETGSGGRYAVLTDPQGAAFAVYASDAPAGAEGPAKCGEFSWHELLTTDHQAAFGFYSALFGWDKISEHNMGDMGIYLIFGRNGLQLGGIYNKPADVPGGPYWLGYVRVKDVNQAVKKAQSAGGKLVMGPMEVPGGDWVAQFTDPSGALFAVHTVQADLKTAVQPGESASSADSLAETMVLSEAEPDAAVEKKQPAKKPSKKPAARSAAAKKKATAKPASKKVASKKGAGKKAAGKKASKKKQPAKAKKTAARKKRSAARSVKRPVAKSARRVAKKVTRRATKTGKKKAARKSATARAGKKKAGKKARKGK